MTVCRPSQYASTRARRRPASPISRTSGHRPPGARNQISSGPAATGANPVTRGGGSVAACMNAGVPQQHTRGMAAQTHSRPPRSRTNSAASLLTSTRIVVT